MKKIKECFNVLQCDGGQKKRKKEKEAFIFTLITLFRFKHWICGFRTFSWGCKNGCPSPILASSIHVVARVWLEGRCFRSFSKGLVNIG